MRILSLLFCLALGGCINHIAGFQDDSRRERSLAFDEMRIELGDLRHALQAQRTEIHLLQERVQEQESTAQAALKERPRSEGFQTQIGILEKKIIALEKHQERVIGDLKLLAKQYEQAGSYMHGFQEKMGFIQTQVEQHTQRLSEVHQLKSTLSQVSKAISEKSAPAKYRVKSGDTLEKISRTHHISIPSLKKVNRLNDDRISIGQELIVSNEDP